MGDKDTKIDLIPTTPNQAGEIDTELYWTDSMGELLEMEPFVLEDPDQYASLTESHLHGLFMGPLLLGELAQFQEEDLLLFHHDLLFIEEYSGEAPTPNWFAHMLEAESTQDQLVYLEALEEKEETN